MHCVHVHSGILYDVSALDTAEMLRCTLVTSIVLDFLWKMIVCIATNKISRNIEDFFKLKWENCKYQEFHYK